MRTTFFLLAILGCHNAPTADDGVDPPDAATASWTHDPGLEGAQFRLDDPACVDQTTQIQCTDVVYSVVDGVELHLDLYAPPIARTQRVPVVVYAHPGGWSVGSFHSIVQLQHESMIDQGIAVITVEYRLTLTPAKQVSGVVFPANLADYKTAIRWVRMKAAGFVDGDRILAYGVSAGAHLASLIATAPRVAALDGRGDPSVPTSVKAMVGLSTPIDFHLFVPANPPLDPSCPSQPPGQDPQLGVSWLLGGDLNRPQYDDALTAMGMMHYLDASSPPMLLFAGTCDQTVPYTGATEVAHLGFPQVQVVIVPNAFHATTLDPPSSQATLSQFITAHL